MKVGFVGIGKMGKAIITNLIKAGHNVVAYDISKEAVDFATKGGARVANSPKEVAETCRVVCTSLPGPAEVESSVLGENGILAGAKSGDIYIDFTTNSPTLLRRIAAIAKEKGVGVLDAPLSGGGPDVVLKKGMTALVGGNKEVLEKGRGIIEDVCKQISHCGENVGDGTVVKLINNYAAAACMDIFFESMSLAAKEGLDLNVMWERFSNSIFGPLFKAMLLPRVLAGNFEPQFALDLAYEVVKLALEEGKALNVPMYYGALSLEKLVEAKARGLGQKDHTAKALLWEELLGIKIRI
jgi:2-hydroxy-3-oxopropionate reductase